MSEYWKVQRHNHLLIGSSEAARKLVASLFKQWNDSDGLNAADPDLLLLEGDMGIDDARKLKDWITLNPWKKHKICFIDARCTIHFWQAVLKVFEETPDNTTIFVSLETPAQLPETILSRLKQFRLDASDEKPKLELKKEFIEAFKEAEKWSKKDKKELLSQLKLLAYQFLNSKRPFLALDAEKCRKRISVGENATTELLILQLKFARGSQ